MSFYFFGSFHSSSKLTKSDAFTKTPWFGKHEKYRLPPDLPSFLPFASSSSIPAYGPCANWTCREEGTGKIGEEREEDGWHISRRNDERPKEGERVFRLSYASGIRHMDIILSTAAMQEKVMFHSLSLKKKKEQQEQLIAGAAQQHARHACATRMVQLLQNEVETTGDV